MSNYAILDIETDTLYGCYSMLGIAKVVKAALDDMYENEARFSIIRFEYITMKTESSE